MPRKQFLADLENLIAVKAACKSDEDGTVIVTTAAGVECTLIFLSISDYPQSSVLVTTEDDLLAGHLADIGNLTGTISDVKQAIEATDGEPLWTLRSEEEDIDIYYWCRIPFASARLPENVMRAMNIIVTDDLLMCVKASNMDWQVRFYTVNSTMCITDEDVKSIFQAKTASLMVNYRKLYFEWTLIDYAAEIRRNGKVNGNENTFFKDLRLEIEKRLQKLHTCCVVCHQPFKQSIEVIKPTVCTEEFCSYRFVEYGLGADVPYEIRHSPYIVDMLIQFTHAASVSTDTLTLEPFPHGIGGERLTRKDVAVLIEKMPAVITMQEWVDKNTLVSNLALIDKLLYPLLRWILCTNTSFIEEVDNVAEKVVGIPRHYKQFRISGSSLTKEEAFRLAKKEHAVTTNPLYAFHGSGVQNWHSILRNGLHSRKVTNARAYGDGIYHALDTVTARGYSRTQNRDWGNAALVISSCFTLNELVNCPNRFVSTQPYLVVEDVDWVQLRYIFVATKAAIDVSEKKPTGYHASASYLNLALSLTSDGKSVVKVPSFEERIKDVDSAIMEPVFATPFASKTIMRDIMAFTKCAPSWLVFHPQNVENLYRWKVHIINFDSSLPLAQDLFRFNLTGITLELCFGPNYPIAPPFIRIVTPRMLQFCHGGGGHVTAGGSICMDLLTDSGWLPSYTLESLLLQVKMALCSLDPRPARVDPRAHNKSYSRNESWDAFTRVARDHGWKVDSNGRNYYV